VTPAEILAAAGRHGLTVWHIPSGEGWRGSGARRTCGGRRVLLSNAQRIMFGLSAGGADIIGFKSVIVEPSMVGQRLAVFTAIGQRGDCTTEFIDTITAGGGLAALVSDQHELEDLLR